VTESSSPGGPGTVPYLRVVRGDATPEEIAALVATLTAVAAAARARSVAETASAAVRSNWNSPARRLRAPLSPAPGAWRRSALP
jgi:hypothetical protein